MDIAARVHALVNRIGQPNEANEVRRLRGAVQGRIARLRVTPGNISKVIAGGVAERPVSAYVAELLARLFEWEGYFELPPEILNPTTAELWDQRSALIAQERLLTNFDDTMDLVEGVFEQVVEPIRASRKPSLFQVPLHAQIPHFPNYLDTLIGLFLHEQVVEAGLFERLRSRLIANLEAADRSGTKPPSRHPSNDSDTLIDAYFGGTPFPAFFAKTVSLPVSEETFFSHMHVVGGSGAGKTQFLQNLVLHHLDREDPPALVIIDSQGDFVPKLSRLARFDPNIGDLSDRLVMITPRDIEHPPAINVFDIGSDRLGRYDAATREQVVAGVIQTFDYLFSGLLGADLTAKQSVFFRYVTRLLISLPETLGRNATILDMIALMDDPTPYLPAIASLPPIQRQFFERDFVGKTFNQTREQIRYRLNAILENPTLERLFTAPETKLDLFSELQRGAIILVDTDKSFLKGASGIFGRIMISLVLQAVLERAALAETERTPAFLIVDEAAEYFDSNIDDLLTEARKYRLGCTFAHQYLDQCTHSLRASLSANTTIKMAAGISTSDARALAPDLRTTADFILGQPRGHFAAHVRNVTGQAVSVPVRFGTLEEREKMPEEAFREVRRRNWERVGAEMMCGAYDAGDHVPTAGTTSDDGDASGGDIQNTNSSSTGDDNPDNPDTDAGREL